jgi:DNA-binding transcriptional regulator LsrR (DeoR family)
MKTRMPYNQELLHKVAKLYYIEDLKQESIARRLKISRYKVSRVLKRAKDKGMVRIEVMGPGFIEDDRIESG